MGPQGKNREPPCFGGLKPTSHDSCRFRGKRSTLDLVVVVLGLF